MKLGMDNLLVAISLAISLKLWKGESSMTPFIKLSYSGAFMLATEFLNELLAVNTPLDFLLSMIWCFSIA